LKKVLAFSLLAIFINSVLPHASVGFTVDGQTSAGAVKAEQWTLGKSDLTLTSDDIVFSPTSPTEGEIVIITATIRNVGEGWAWSVKVGFYKGSPAGELIGTDTVGWLLAGGSETVSVEWIAELGYDICVVADPDNTISELKEDNNVAYGPNPVAPASPIHDVAVISVTPSQTEVTAGDIVTITVVVENQGTETETFDVTAYYDSTAIGTSTVTALVAGATETLTFSWNTTGLEGTYTIEAGASVVPGEEDTADNMLTDGTVTVSAPGEPPTATHELFIEIDYIEGHAPTPEVLDYIEWYYMGNNPSGELIEVTFYIDDQISYSGAYAGISDDEFWDIEAQYNDHDYGYYSKWKWVLFGTTVEGSPNVVGYTYVVIKTISWWSADMVAGNYIYIADGTADSWAANNGIEAYGAEAVVLMHEMGHSIGIGKLERSWWYGWVEVYDPDPYSVMSYLSTANAGLYGNWYYSDEYWATKNMEYYTV
jgi:hypothetical protein